jgi:protein TonB
LKQTLPPIAFASSLSSNDILLLTLLAAFVVHLAVIFGFNVNLAMPRLHPKTVEVSVIHPPVHQSIKQTVSLPKSVKIKNRQLVVPAKLPEKKRLPVTHLQPQLAAIPKSKSPLKAKVFIPAVETAPPESIYQPPPVVNTPATPEVVAPVPVIVVEKEEVAVATPPSTPLDPIPLPVTPTTPPPENMPKVIAEPAPAVVETAGEPIALSPVEQTDVAIDAGVATTPSKKSNRKTGRKTKPLPKHRHNSAPPLTLANLDAQIMQAGEKFATLSEPSTSHRVKNLGSVGKHNYVARQYIADWQRKVEKIGNLNYPQAAREKDFSATLVMEVGIKSDGSVQSMKIKKSSGNTEVDEAAKNIVQMSTPFAPLPKELENELDVLVIRRTWQFSDESGISTH